MFFARWEAVFHRGNPCSTAGKPHKKGLSTYLSTPVDNFQWKTPWLVENPWSHSPCRIRDFIPRFIHMSTGGVVQNLQHLLAVEPHSGSSLEPKVKFAGKFFECVEPLDEMISQIDCDSGFTESKGSVQPDGSCPEASDFRLLTPDLSYPHPLLPLRPHEMGLSPKLSTSVDNFRWKTFYPVENPGTPGWPGFFRFLSSSYAQGPDKRAGICYTILIQPLEPAGSFSIQRCGNIAGRRLSGKPPGPWRFSSCSGNLYHIEGCPP